MFAIIQAGGKGTRLKDIAGDLPKPMVKVAGKPILEWQISNLRAQGIVDIVLVISKNGQAIFDYFGDGAGFNVKIRYIREETPLGTGGALYYASSFINDDCLVLFGDLMFDIDWGRFLAFHHLKGGEITAFSHPSSHPSDSDLLIIDGEERILDIDQKGHDRSYFYSNLTNAGLYVVKASVLKAVTSPAPVDFEKTILKHYVEEGKAYAYRSSEYVKDCGTPDRYYQVNQDFANGIIAAKNLSLPQRCLFLDRDGTINKFGGFVTSTANMELKPDAIEAIRLINQSAFLAICITNQPVIARGETTMAELTRIHQKMADLLGEGGAYLDDLYFCPHYPMTGFPGELSEYKIVCDCRKPKIGMLTKARERYHIDFQQSWMIGDTKQDVQTGINAGCRTALVMNGDPNPNRHYPEAVPTLTSSSLLEAVRAILGMTNAVK